MKRTQSAPKPPADSSSTLSTETLVSLTGYTARYLRDLAKAGYYPPPEHGRYLTTATLKGLFQHEHDERAKKDDTEKKARAAYWETKRKREQFDFDQEQDRYVEAAELAPALRNISLHMASVLRRKLEIELPARLRGKSELEVRAEMKLAVDAIYKIFHDGILKWL